MLLVKTGNQKETMRMNTILMWKRGHHVLHGQKMTICDWLKEICVSGQYAEMLKEKALQMYKDETKQHFTLYYWWTEELRPQGVKGAKAKAKGKLKVPSGNLSREDIELYHESQTVRAASTEKMAEVQLQVAKDQREAALAKERIELAKNERQIIDKYTTLLMADTTHYKFLADGLADILFKNGCDDFASLVTAMVGAARTYQKSADGGLTIFCPTDKAVAAFTSRFKNLTADAQLALLLYHDVAKHYSENALKTINGEVNTLATDGTKSFDLTIKNHGDAMRGGSGGKEVGGKGRGLINGRRCAGKQQRWAKLLLLLPGARRGIWRRRKKRGGAESDAILAERQRTLCATAG
ncbi:hypothetical protein GUJ93_ZPchr0004g39715 [Zizania palustris]|uniref:FAS1 domain-containing protein n=1 Tax=Zizania palustris TaxID=103762 RepID=A0A8J5SPS2_ZIZPA|nr:hypothetical protein GUJ93_ZPchr0004g39715 [Zizania palustris]